MKYSIFLFFFISLFYNSVIAQEEIEEQKDISLNIQYWLDYNSNINLKDELRDLRIMVGYRGISPHVFDKYLATASYDILNTKSPEFLNLKKPLINSFHLGGGLYYTNIVESDNDFEFRLMQGFSFFTPKIATIYFKNYIRLEERFQTSFDGSSWNDSYRIRYKISTVLEWKHLFEFNKGMYIPMNVEFFFNLKKADRFNDVIRISPGIGYKLNDDWKFETFISYHYTKITSENDSSTNDFVIRLRIYKLSTKKGLFKESKEENIKDLIE